MRFLITPLRFAACLSLVMMTGAAFAAMAPVPAPENDNDWGILAFTIPLPEGKVSQKQVHAAVLKAAIGREWSVKVDLANKVVIHLLHRSNEATVTFLISEKNIEAYCLGYAVDKQGNHKKPEQPERWLNYLKKDITEAINQATFGQ